MKRVLFIAFLFIALRGSAQIPNASFESWNNGNPEGWYTANGATTYVTATFVAHDSAAAALSESQELFSGFYVVSPVRTGDLNHYFYTCNCEPQALHFWYKTNLTAEETFLAQVGGHQGGMQSTGGVATITNSTDVYTEGIVPLLYTQAGLVDSMTIVFTIVTTNTTGSAGATSSFVVDDLAWGSLTSVETVSPEPATLEFISSSGTQTNIGYTLHRNANVRLDVYDAMGRLVKTVLEATQLQGRYKAVDDFRSFNNGIYFCRLTVDGVAFSKTFVISN